jgi:intracellular sulfur oxidation DsrE/DsrF family protein
MRRLLHSFLALIGSLLICGAALAQDKVVYHIDNAEAQATKGLRNIRNHLDVAPETKIIVVTHADGVDFLMDGAKDKKNPSIDYASLVSALKARGVRFEVCEITLKKPQPEERPVQHGCRIHALRRGAHRPVADTRAVRLHQTLRRRPGPLAGALSAPAPRAWRRSPPCSRVCRKSRCRRRRCLRRHQPRGGCCRS